MSKMANIKKNDTVKIITGKDNGKTGRVVEVIPEKEKLIVDNLNVFKKHQKQRQNREAGIVDKAMPLHVSNVQPVCPKCAEPTSFRRKATETGDRIRYCKKCGETLD